MQELVSVVLPTYNRGHLIRRAIENLLEQTYPNFEIIIVNDGSQDSTRENVLRFDDPRIRYIEHETNKGEAEARNTGIRAATGEYIACQDDDCLWYPEKLEKHMAVFDGDASLGVAYCGAWFNNHAERKVIPEVELDGYVYRELLAAYFIGSVQMIIKKACFEKVGLFDSTLPAGIDWDMWIRLAKYYRFKGVREPLMEIVYDADTSYYGRRQWMDGELALFDKHYNEYKQEDKKGLANKCFNLGIMLCSEKDDVYYRVGQIMLWDAATLRPTKLRYWFFAGLSVFRWLYRSTKLRRLYWRFKRVANPDTIKSIRLSAIGVWLWLKDRHYRGLKNEERFWSRLFANKSVNEFEGWVSETPASRQAVSNFVKENDIETILDVGCGTGMDYEQYRKEGLEVKYCGIDFTRPFVEAAQKKYPEITVTLASSENIPYPHNIFDMVSCRHLLEHLANPAKTLAEMARVSRKYVVVTWFLPPGKDEDQKVVEWQGRKRVHFNHYSAAHIKSIIKDLGLTLQDKITVENNEIWVMTK